MHSTNYFNTFIEISEDSSLERAKIPSLKDKNPSVAQMQYEMIAPNPYAHQSDDVIFEIWAKRQGKTNDEATRETYFSKGQPCLRTSPLAKTHGFGFHFDEAGRVALYAVESDEYARFAKADDVKHLKAMRNKRAG